MFFAANIAVEQKVFVAAIMIAFFCICTPDDVYQHIFNRTRVATLLQDNDSRSCSTKLVHIEDVDLNQLLSYWCG